MMIGATLVLTAAVVMFPEQAYGPYVRPRIGRVPSHAVAAGRSGVLLAWSERDRSARIRVALLDQSARLISPIADVAVPDSNAIAPSIASNGSTFFVAFIASSDRVHRTYGVPVSAAGVPLGAPRPYGEAVVTAGAPAPVPLLWDGSAYRLAAADGRELAVSEDGTVLGKTSVPDAMNDAGAPATLDVADRLVCSGPGGGGPFKCGLETRYELTWRAGAESGQLLLGRDPVLAAIAPAGRQFAIAWVTAKRLGYLLTGAAVDTVDLALGADPDQAPAIDCDATRCVIAYATPRGDIHGVVFETERPRSPELLAIAFTERIERGPRVRALGGGRFLVSYDSDLPGAEHVAGRVLAFEKPKQRGARH